MPGWFIFLGFTNIWVTKGIAEEFRPWLRLARLRNSEVLCEDNVNFVKNELSQCLKNCHPLTPTDFLPTRLLDVGDGTVGGGVRLVETKNFSPSDRTKAAYVTLSYCWGSPKDALAQLKTTMENFARMIEAIPRASMSQTLIDAVHVCQALGVRYLWVDAVCIIQDSVGDWELESAMMAHIYQHSIFTAYAWSSTSCQESFLRRNRKSVDVEFRSRLSPGIKGRFSLVSSGYRMSGPDIYDGGFPYLDDIDAELESRGWSLQEKEMSPRKLLFGKAMLHWQCSHTQSENGLARGLEGGNMLEFLRDAGDRAEYCSWPRRAKQRHWLDILPQHCHRELTYPTDRLPSLSGMAKILSDRTKDRYLAGIWEVYLPESLLWSVVIDLKRDRPTTVSELAQRRAHAVPYIAPSWSPLSTQRSIKYPALGVEQYVKSEIDVLETNVAVQGLNPFGMIQSGYVKLRGRVPRLEKDVYFETDDFDRPDHRNNVWYLRTSQGILSSLSLDWWPPRGTIEIEAEGMCMLAVCSGMDEDALAVHEAPATDLAGENDKEVSHGGDVLSEPLEDMSLSRDAVKENQSLETNTEQQSSHKVDIDEQEEDLLPSTADANQPQGPIVERNRDLHGLLLYPSGEDGKYYRVGMWSSRFSNGYGKDYFDQFEAEEVVII